MADKPTVAWTSLGVLASIIQHKASVAADEASFTEDGVAVDKVRAEVTGAAEITAFQTLIAAPCSTAADVQTKNRLSTERLRRHADADDRMPLRGVVPRRRLRVLARVAADLTAPDARCAMSISKKLGEIVVNGRQVSVFSPPHSDPDFPWVDVEELARAYVSRTRAKRIVAMTKDFGGTTRAYATARNGDRIAIIVCHAMAQGVCGLVDFENGYRDEFGEGPVHRAYSLALGVFAAEHWPMDFDAIFHAFKNPGGPFMDSEFSSGRENA